MIDALTASLACIGPSRSTALTSPSTSQALQSVAGGLAPETENLVWWRELRGVVRALRACLAPGPACHPPEAITSSSTLGLCFCAPADSRGSHPFLGSRFRGSPTPQGARRRGPEGCCTIPKRPHFS